MKISIRSYKPNEYFLRLHNLDDSRPKSVMLYDKATKESAFLKEVLKAPGKIKIDGDVIEKGLSTTKDKKDIKNDFDHYQNPFTPSDNDSFILKQNEIKTLFFKVILEWEIRNNSV